MNFGLSKLSWSPFPRMSGNAPFLSRPTNITQIIGGLFVLCALGWIIKRVTGPNFRSIVPFSEVGSKALRLFWQIFPNSQKPDPKATTPSTTQTGIPPENGEMALSSVKFSNEQLLEMMIFAQDDKGKLTFDLKNSQNQTVRLHLRKIIRQEFAMHAKEGEVQMARALAPLFALANSDPDRFMVLVNTVIEVSVYCLRFTVTVLEEIQWPSEKLKQENLPVCLADYIKRHCLIWQSNSIPIEAPSSSEESTYFRTSRLLVDTARIFGHGNFVTKPEPLSPFLEQGLGIAIRNSGIDAMLELEQTHNDGNIDDETNIGLNLVVGQFAECRFPASMVAPVLPYLTKVPGLVGLEMTDVGGSGPASTKHHAFRDQDAPALLDILRTNPYLFHFKINTNGMTREAETRFMQDRQSILKDRRRPTIEDLLAPEATKEHKADSDDE